MDDDRLSWDELFMHLQQLTAPTPSSEIASVGSALAEHFGHATDDATVYRGGRNVFNAFRSTDVRLQDTERAKGMRLHTYGQQNNYRGIILDVSGKKLLVEVDGRRRALNPTSFYIDSTRRIAYATEREADQFGIFAGANPTIRPQVVLSKQDHKLEELLCDAFRWASANNALHDIDRMVTWTHERFPYSANPSAVRSMTSEPPLGTVLTEVGPVCRHISGFLYAFLASQGFEPLAITTPNHFLLEKGFLVDEASHILDATGNVKRTIPRTPGHLRTIHEHARHCVLFPYFPDVYQQ